MMREYKTVVVAIDGSKKADFAFEKAIDIVLQFDGTLIVAHAIDTPATYDPIHSRNNITEGAELFAHQLLNGHKAEALKRGVKDVRLELIKGSPKYKLTGNIIPKYDADLIVCGAGGLNAVERFFVGSVSESITRRAECDVLIVKDWAEED